MHRESSALGAGLTVPGWGPGETLPSPLWSPTEATLCLMVPTSSSPHAQEKAEDLPLSGGPPLLCLSLPSLRDMDGSPATPHPCLASYGATPALPTPASAPAETNALCALLPPRPPSLHLGSRTSITRRTPWLHPLSMSCQHTPRFVFPKPSSAGTFCSRTFHDSQWPLR